jgi:hypothetical protein
MLVDQRPYVGSAPIGGLFRPVGRLGGSDAKPVFLARGSDGQWVAARRLGTSPPAESADALHLDSAGDRSAGPPLAAAVQAERAADRITRFCNQDLVWLGEHAGSWFLVTGFGGYQFLGHHVQTAGPLAGVDLEVVTLLAATALAALHRSGRVHGGFSPAHVLNGADGPVVLDFLVDPDPEVKELLGFISPHAWCFLTPEQVTGAATGPATDVFAWASTMVYAATGHPPFPASDETAQRQRLLSEPPNLGTLPPHLAVLFGDCLSKDPARRPGTDDVLLRLFDSLGTLARPEPARPEPAGTGLAGTGLADNGLADNGLAGNGLAGTGLAGTGLAGTGLADQDLADADPAVRLAASPALEPVRELVTLIRAERAPQRSAVAASAATGLTEPVDISVGRASARAAAGISAGTSADAPEVRGRRRHTPAVLMAVAAVVAVVAVGGGVAMKLVRGSPGPGQVPVATGVAAGAMPAAPPATGGLVPPPAGGTATPAGPSGHRTTGSAKPGGAPLTGKPGGAPLTGKPAKPARSQRPVPAPALSTPRRPPAVMASTPSAFAGTWSGSLYELPGSGQAIAVTMTFTAGGTHATYELPTLGCRASLTVTDVTGQRSQVNLSERIIAGPKGQCAPTARLSVVLTDDVDTRQPQLLVFWQDTTNPDHYAAGTLYRG